jgi:hypothetical protein
MGGSFLTEDTAMQCPHGGTVTAQTTNAFMQADGAFVLLATDVFVIAGCTLISSSLSPCTTIVWDVPSQTNTVMGVPVLTSASQGLCMGSATPAPPIIVTVQTEATGL